MRLGSLRPLDGPSLGTRRGMIRYRERGLELANPRATPVRSQDRARVELTDAAPNRDATCPLIGCGFAPSGLSRETAAWTPTAECSRRWGHKGLRERISLTSTELARVTRRGRRWYCIVIDHSPQEGPHATQYESPFRSNDPHGNRGGLSDRASSAGTNGARFSMRGAPVRSPANTVPPATECLSWASPRVARTTSVCHREVAFPGPSSRRKDLAGAA